MEKSKLLEFCIVGVIEENHLAKTYQLELRNADQLSFKPGQFLTFLIETEKHEIRRSYSILSLPTEPLKITVKKVENGAISRFILQNWKVGELVYSLPPFGRFYVEPQSGKPRDIFCFAAGSGIVPILPQIRKLLEDEPQSRIHLIYSNRNEKETLFLREIETLAQNFDQLHLIKQFSEPEEQLEHRGRLSNISTEILIQKSLVHNRTDAVFLLCGPFAYMRMLLFTIGLMGFRKDHIKKESYIPSIMNPVTATSKTFSERTVTIILDSTSTVIKVAPGNSILDAAIKAGIHLPYSCRGGVCGSCAAKCKSGSIYMSINEVLTDNDLKQDWVLTCTGFPEEDSVLDFNA
ncbi:iron-sulfur cluster-binding domain-containing protein [Desertivirga arenae]|uniref:iron-sulfur cluster-binding domain-containing protein n=1 Tax=Desertivirga arenae TaxID=2810309 RepID=UPI001A976F11|nr:iron-sulfur cluster-binding domain-containing protein [Pedobacter sp. SYSU D00823]